MPYSVVLTTEAEHHLARLPKRVQKFVHDELDSLVTLIFSTSVFGVSAAEDLYVVPNHARYILKTDHHDVIHIDFRLSDEVDRWVSELARRGFPLPGDLPDETFKQPTWMKGKNR